MMTTMDLYPVPYRHSRGALGRMGAVGRILAAYIAFIAVSLLCFGAMTLLSLLP